MEQSLSELERDGNAVGRVHAIPDLRAPQRFAPSMQSLQALGIQATLMIPIHVQQLCWGLLFINQDTSYYWSDAEVSLVKQVALQLGIALHQALLQNQLTLTQAELRQINPYDALTQLLTPQSFEQILEKEWHRMHRAQAHLSLILCEVDSLHPLIEHTRTDQLGQNLKEIAKAIKAILHRPGDEVAHLASGQFGILLPETPLQGACYLAETMRCAVENLDIPHGQSKVSDRLTVSLGVASFTPKDSREPEYLLEQAHCALTDAQENGGNQWLAVGLEQALNSMSA